MPTWSSGESAASAPPSRIVTIAPNSAEIICALGACDSIVGVDKFSLYPPELKSRPRVGGLFDPDLEKIVSLNPDLVVIRGRNDTLERLCGTLGIALYHDRTESLADVPTCITELGRVLGREDRAKELVREFQSRIEAVRSRVAERPRPRVLVTVSRQPGSFLHTLTTGKGVFITETIDLAGGVNVFRNLDMGYPQVSPEGMVATRPEVIIEFMPEVELTDALRERVVAEWRNLGSLPAVEKGRIHILSDDHCLIPSPRYVEIIEKVSRLVHPELDVERSRPAASE